MSKHKSNRLALQEEASNKTASLSQSQNSNLTKQDNFQQNKQEVELPIRQIVQTKEESDLEPRSNVNMNTTMAREQERKLGENSSQVLETRYQALLHSINNDINNKKNQDYAKDITNHSFSSSTNIPRYSVRVISTEERIDPAGAGYTVYILEVESLSTVEGTEYSHDSKLQQQSYLKKHFVARRYSDFARLHSLLESHNISCRATFPAKSLAGRLGNWTPAMKFAPSARHDLITFRKIQFDIWLVELAEKLGHSEIPDELQSFVIDFLTQEENLPPCHQKNDISPLKLIHKATNNRQATTENVVNYQVREDNDNSHGINGDVHQFAKSSAHNHAFHINLSNPLSFTLGSEIRKAVSTLKDMTQMQIPHTFSSPSLLTNRSSLDTPTSTSFQLSKSPLMHSIPDQSIPLDLLHQAWGLCFLTVIKAGIIFSGRVGTGLLIARTTDGGWSAPCAVGTVGMGWGALVGGDITNYLIILNTKKAVKSFASNSVNFGAEVGIAVGPVGRGGTGNLNAGLGEKSLVSAYSYAHSKGFFVGLSLEGSVVKVRGDVNAKFYGKRVEADEILFGNMGERPRAAKVLYDALDEAMNQRIEGWRPSDAIMGLRNNRREYVYRERSRK